MKLFLTKFLLFILPVLLVIGILEFFLRKIPNDYSYKYQFLTSAAEETETLILGSSHAVYGIDPEAMSRPAFNAAHVSQSLKYDKMILATSLGHLPKLKTVILPVSYFSLHTSLESSAESWRVKNYHLYYQCDSCATAWNHRFELLTGQLSSNALRVINWIMSGKDDVTSLPSGYGSKYLNQPQKDLVETGQKAALRHTHPESEEVPGNLAHLKAIQSLCEENGLTLILCTFPATGYYREAIDPDQLEEMTSACEAMAESNSQVTYLNLLDDPRFGLEDFRDGDHLNLEGARKLASVLDEVIR